uniref:M20 family metallopeptidase n=1 Tax=Bosea sp. NBC_00436 TaxID=2969620 RepID=A0A9E7ZS94_9HYPH
MNSDPIWRLVDELGPRYIDLADRVWAVPETLYQEFRSSAEHAAMLETEGYKVTRGLAGIETALMGEAGEGGPVIAFLGEYDALPGLSQEAGSTTHNPVEADGPGHGCGHNLLGSASMLAASAVKDYLAANKLPGRVRYYGCPAEEGGAGKTFMVRAGCFDDVDIAICWHPAAFPGVIEPDSLANTRIDFSFAGRAAHAAASPHLGRSALDAVELMNVGVNYLREHMPSDARVHYAVVDTGGIAPNVVQAQARVRYSVRAGTTPAMFELLGRVRKIAQGAALMTETAVSETVLAGVSNLLGNPPLERAMHAQLERLGPPEFDEADRAFAAEIRKTVGPEDIASDYYRLGLPFDRDKLMADRIVPLDAKSHMSGSTDVGDVSWVVPTVQAHGATYAIGTQLHTWQMTAQGKLPAAHKGMVHVAKALAALATEVLTKPELLAAAKTDHAGRTADTPYTCPIPPEVNPPRRKAAGA